MRRWRGAETLLPGLLEQLLRDPFLKKGPPKTAGREQYGEKFVGALLAHREARGAKAEDLVRTATIFTALSILDAVHRFVSPRAKISELIVSGGGARNPLLMAQIANRGCVECGCANRANSEFRGREGSVCVCGAGVSNAAAAGRECAGSNGGEEGGGAGQGVLCGVRGEEEEVKKVENRKFRTRGFGLRGEVSSTCSLKLFPQIFNFPSLLFFLSCH